MTIFIVLYLLLFLSTFFEREDVPGFRKKEILIFWVVIFTLFRGLRWQTGTDWEQYYQVFLTASWDNLFSFARNSSVSMESGYVLLNVLVKTIGGNYTVFLLLTNFFVMVAYMKFALTNSKTPIYIFVLIMFSTQFFPVRIGIAVAVILLGLCNFSQRKYKRVIAYTLVAASIHSSAFAFIPVYFFGFFKKVPTKLALAGAVMLMIIAQLPFYNGLLVSVAGGLHVLGDEASHKFETYINYDVTKNSGAIIAFAGIVSNTIFIVLLILFGNMIKKQSAYLKSTNVNYDFLFNIYFVFIMIAIAFPGNNMAGLRRLQNYFMFAFPILFSTFILFNKKRYPQYAFVYMFAFFFYVLFRSYSLFFAGHLESNFPYLSVLDNAF
jgi:hypothetical protein